MCKQSQYQERQKAFSLDDIINLLNNAGFSNIDCYNDLNGGIATAEKFDIYVCIE